MGLIERRNHENFIVKNDSTSRFVKIHEGPPMAHKVARLGCAPARAKKILIPKHTSVFDFIALFAALLVSYGYQKHHGRLESSSD